jgi:hypothetical protein
MRRYEKRKNQYIQNKMFKEDTKQFYRCLEVKTTAINDHPHMEEVELYWKSLWEEKVQHNEKADWIKREEKEKIDSMNWMPIKTTETTSFLSKLTTGSLLEANYWLRAFPATHSYITKFINTIIEEPNKIPDWLTTGITYLLPKSEDTKEPKNYRPITGLSTMYKTLTGIIARRITYSTFGRS